MSTLNINQLSLLHRALNVQYPKQTVYYQLLHPQLKMVNRQLGGAENMCMHSRCTAAIYSCISLKSFIAFADKLPSTPKTVCCSSVWTTTVCFGYCTLNT